MKIHTRGLAALAAAAIGLVALVPTASATDSVISDPQLAKCVNNAVGTGRDAATPITAADLAGITRLVCPGRIGADISGLRYATNLDTLWLLHGQFSDLTPLAGLKKLQFVKLGSDRIGDVSPLAGLTNLQNLEVGGFASFIPSKNKNAPLSDVSPLAGLGKLTVLSVATNSITDISPLARLTGLKELNISNNRITDLRPVAGFAHLRNLYADGNDIADISMLAPLPLVRLTLSRNRVADFSVAKRLPHLDLLHSKSYDERIQLTATGGKVANPLRDYTGAPITEISREKNLSLVDGQFVLAPGATTGSAHYKAKVGEGFISGDVQVTAAKPAPAPAPAPGPRPQPGHTVKPLPAPSPQPTPAPAPRPGGWPGGVGNLFWNGLNALGGFLFHTIPGWVGNVFGWFGGLLGVW